MQPAVQARANSMSKQPADQEINWAWICKSEEHQHLTREHSRGALGTETLGGVEKPSGLWKKIDQKNSKYNLPMTDSWAQHTSTWTRVA
jgi:hypothetical protein